MNRASANSAAKVGSVNQPKGYVRRTRGKPAYNALQSDGAKPSASVATAFDSMSRLQGREFVGARENHRNDGSRGYKTDQPTGSTPPSERPACSDPRTEKK